MHAMASGIADTTADERIAPTRVSAALAVLRVVAGIIFTAHGAQKLFVYGLEGVTGAFAGIGIPFAAIVGPGVALLEFGGGLALVLGLFTKLAAAGLALNMAGAILIVHLAAGFFLPNGVEFALSLFAVSTALVLLGPGCFSMDAVIAGRRKRGVSSHRAAGAERASS